MKERSNKRKRDYKSIFVRLDKAETEQVFRNAEATGLTPAALMRELAKGYKPKSTIDSAHIRELVHLRGDLGRAGGLLKLWLSDDIRIKNYPALDILKIVDNMNSTQYKVQKCVEGLTGGRK